MKHNNNNINVVSLSPPWEVLELISTYLDPITLAIASCVSKSWSSCFSPHYLWEPLCSSHFPGLSSIHATTAATTIHPRRLFAIGYVASRLRVRQPRKPKLSLDDILFTISIHILYNNNSCKSLVPCNNNVSSTKCDSNGLGRVINIVKPCKDTKMDPHGTFRFDVDVEDDGDWSVDELEGVQVTWNVVEKGLKGVFTMADKSGGKKGGFSSSVDGWFSEELPSPGCCSSAFRSSGLVADLRLVTTMVGCSGWNGGVSKVRIEKVSLGVMCILNWRYLTLDDALSYLEHFIHV